MREMRNRWEIGVMYVLAIGWVFRQFIMIYDKLGRNRITELANYDL